MQIHSHSTRNFLVQDIDWKNIQNCINASMLKMRPKKRDQRLGNISLIRRFQINRKSLEDRYGISVNEIVECLRDDNLQSAHSAEEAKEKYSGVIAPGHLAEKLEWFYFESPRWTWEQMCGTAGWYAVSGRNIDTLYFFHEKMS